MQSALLALKLWFQYVSSSRNPLSRERLSWNDGWVIPFWFVINRNWIVMEEMRLLIQKESEALWDPEDTTFTT